MHKLILVITLSLFLFFPGSEAYGACEYCAQGSDTGSGQCAVLAGPRGAGFVPKAPGCAPGMQASTTNISDTACQCVTPGTAGAAGPIVGAPGVVAAPAAVGPSTSGSGQRCDPANQGAISATGKGIYTAIGCVPTEPQEFIEGLLKYGTFAAGGIAFLIMIIASLQMITAEGNPESLKNARDKFYSAIIGLLLIVFSVLLMQVIGVDILNLPGFTR